MDGWIQVAPLASIGSGPAPSFVRAPGLFRALELQAPAAFTLLRPKLIRTSLPSMMHAPEWASMVAGAVPRDRARATCDAKP